MNKLFALAVALALLGGCASTPLPESKAGIEDRTPTANTGPQGGSAATPVAPAAEQQVSPLKDPKNILSKRSIFYDYDKYEVKDEYKPLLQAHAKYLSQNPGAKILIQGNCDERGSREYNIALGQKRADGVKKMLELLGVKDGQMESVSLGEEKPRCTEQTEDCYAQNRRSDMLYPGEY